MSLSSIIKSAFKGLNPLSLIGDAIGGVTSLIQGNQANKSAAHLADKQIAAQQQMNQYNVQSQKEMNRLNIASQEKINNQQLTQAREINDLMRRDSQHAISDKRADLMRSGYSTADPSLSDFTSASLTSPTLTAPQGIAPQVESEFSPDIARTLIDAKRQSSDRFLSFAKTASDIALTKAQTLATQKDSKRKDIENAWLELEKSANYAQMLEALNNLQLDGDLKTKVKEKMDVEITNFKHQSDIFVEQLNGLKIENKYLAERLQADLDEIGARVANINADTGNKNIQKEILGFQRDLDELRAKYAKMGINFDSNDIFSSLARLFGQASDSNVTGVLLNGVKAFFNDFIKQIKIF